MSEQSAVVGHPKGRRFAIGLCFLIAVFEGYDIQVIGVVGPALRSALGLNSAELGWVFGSTMIGLMIGAMSGGWLADRLGRRPTLAAGVAVFSIATILTVLCTDAVTFSIARCVTGLGIGAALPNIMAIAADVSSPKDRASTAMMMFCGLPAGAAVAALLASFFPEWPWQNMFYIGGVPPLFLAPLILLALPETSPTKNAASGTRALGAFEALLGNGRGFVTLNIWIAFAFTLAILYLLLNWLFTLVVDKGFTRADAAVALLYFNIAAVFGALILGKIIDRFGLRWPMAAVFAIMLLSFVALAYAETTTQINLICAAVGICIVGSQFVLYGAAPNYYPISARGIGSGAAVALGRLGAIAGPVSAGFILSVGDATSVVFYLAPVIVAAGSACFALSFFETERGEVG